MLSLTMYVRCGKLSLKALRQSAAVRRRVGLVMPALQSRGSAGKHVVNHDAAAAVATSAGGAATDVNTSTQLCSHGKSLDVGTSAAAAAASSSSSGRGRGGGAELLLPFADDVSETVLTPPPLRRVARWFFPGFTHEEKQRATTDVASLQGSAAAPTLAPRRESGSSAPVANVLMEAPTGATPSKSAAVSATPTSTRAAVHGPAHESHVKENAREGVPESPSTGKAVKAASAKGRLDDSLPSAFCDHVLQRNQRLRSILVNALGSEFAKAGGHNDAQWVNSSAMVSAAAKRAMGLRRVSHKLLISCTRGYANAWDWVDITAHPTAALEEYRGALSQVLLDIGTHETLVSDALEPMLLPQSTVIRGCHCLVVRYAVDVASTSMDSFQDLTNRFTILVTNTRVITIHRTHCAFVEDLKRAWPQVMAEHGKHGKTYLLSLFVKESVDTFNTALTRSIVEFDRYEASLFSPERHRSTLAREIYHIKRRASVYARTLNLIGDAYTHVCSALPIAPTDVQFQDVQQDIAHVKSLSEELNANADSVLQLLFQLSSYQLNELMRVLTIFSAFFIPLSFIASIYGMNFTHLPLLEDVYGHMYCFAFMVVVGGGLGVWFKFKHFM